MSDGAPVCNLPNRGQTPPAQAGRLFAAVPKAQDLPSAIAAINALANILLKLASPGLPAFQNNLAPSTTRVIAGTPGIAGALGRSGGSFALDGQNGQNAEQPYWVPTRIETEKIKVTNPDDEDQFVVVKRIRLLEFTDQVSEGGATITFDMKGLR